MKYYHNLYFGDGLKEKKECILHKLEQDEIQWNLYIIALTDNERNHLEFYDSTFIRQKSWKKDLFIVGISRGYEEALLLIQEITQEVYNRTKDVNIRQFFLDEQRKFEQRKV